MINVGGRGVRMGSVTGKVPKPMLELAGKKILEWLVGWAVESGFEGIVMLCGYKSDVVIDHFGDGRHFGIPIEYSVESEPLGSGGAIKLAAEFADGRRFAYISGDLFCRVDFPRMARFHEKKRALMTVAVHKTSHPEDSDILEVGEDGLVVRFVDKNGDHAGAGDLGNAGLCVMEPGVFDYMEPDVFTFETYLYPRLIDAGERVAAYVTEEVIRDLGTPERLDRMERELSMSGVAEA